MNRKKTTGFTLIELMVVIAIIGILASIAYPSYTDKIQKSRRADAKGVLMQFAGAMERRFTMANSYCDAAAAAGTVVANCGDGATKDTGAPTIFATKSPVDGTETYYNLTISAVSPTSFTLSATPTGKQANDKCGTLTLTNTGVRGITSQASGYAVADCW
jgi:type IV pilus assembly protein PilE